MDERRTNVYSEIENLIDSYGYNPGEYDNEENHEFNWDTYYACRGDLLSELFAKYDVVPKKNDFKNFVLNEPVWDSEVTKNDDSWLAPAEDKW